MKKNVFLMGLLAIVLAFSMAVVGCDSGSNGTEGDGITYDPIVYTSYADGNTYELVITKGSGRATFTPGAGDSYVLTITVTATGFTVATSSGTVSSNTSGEITLKQKDSEEPFTITVNTSGEMTAINPPLGSNAIPADGDKTVEAPPALTQEPSVVTPKPVDPPGGEPANPLAGTTWTWIYYFGARDKEDLVNVELSIANGFPEEITNTLTFTDTSFTWTGMNFKLGWYFIATRSDPAGEQAMELVYYDYRPDSYSGTYTLSGNTVNLLYSNGGTRTCTLNGDTLTYTYNDDYSETFTKQ